MRPLRTDRTDPPLCHVFEVAGEAYAFDAVSSEILAIDPPFAAALREPHGELDGPVAEALQRARSEGLFLAPETRLVPRAPAPGVAVDIGLRHLVLTVSEACNLRCAYCPHGEDLEWQRPHRERHMPVDVALAATEYYLERRDPDREIAISFYGGEPLVNREAITAVVERVRSAPGGESALLTVDTNGLLLEGDLLEFAVRHRLRLQISLDGPPEIHDRYRRDAKGRPTCARILDNIRRLLDRDPSAADRLVFAVTIAPPVDLVAIAEFFADFPPYRERGYRRQAAVNPNFARLYGGRDRWADEESAGLPPLSEQVEALRVEYFGAVAAGRRANLSPITRNLFERDLISLYHRSREVLEKRFSPGGNCAPGQRKLQVTVDGRLQPCERTGDGMVIGTLETGIQAARVVALYEDFHAAVADRCADCWALRLCGVCFAVQASGEKREDGVRTVPEATCERIRRRWESVMKLMVRILALPEEARAWLDATAVD